MKDKDKEQLVWEKGKPIPANAWPHPSKQNSLLSLLMPSHDSNTRPFQSKQNSPFSWLPPSHDPDIWRLDAYGNIIHRDLYGRRVQYGWEIDHIVPLSDGGSDDISNLQPLQWKKNRELGDKKA